MTLFGNWDEESLQAQLPVAREYGKLVSLAIRHCRLYLEALRALQGRDQFISVASHELRSPLAALKLQLELLGRGELESGDSRLMAERILKSRALLEKAVKKLSDNVERIFDLALLRKDQFDIVKTEVDLTGLVEEMIARNEPALHAVGCKIRKKLQPGVKMHADLLRIEQVIGNLLSNAGKYAPQKPIEVILSADDRGIRFLVRDHGPGIPLGDQRKVFDCFYRSSQGNLGNGNGHSLGLGLYICKRIVEGHGGTISLFSEPGQGAEFLVELPG
jgi:signal transduction histidine kinase